MMKAAMSLFGSRGYESVKLEEIAHEAGVSPGTLYSYFKTKNDLLLAVLIQDFELGFKNGRLILEGPLSDGITAINQLLLAHFSRRQHGLTEDMWRFAIAAFISHPDTHFAIEYEKCLTQMHNQFLILIQKLKVEGHLPNYVYADNLASVITNSAIMSFLKFIRKPNVSSEKFEAKLLSQNSQLIKLAQQASV
ncbi:HTH-type transcriptional repressor KstR [Ruegeria denitrificans]|uniref:HTH-type transcriptional repressor KstR n=2 Tax=Ruegeria denitrificans TaxID=1715692 RepID=A0A0P1IK42_9RHOB|nr:HTH-type transcriptional repressor KstR [Ruegeria denitrificans]